MLHCGAYEPLYESIYHSLSMFTSESDPVPRIPQEAFQQAKDYCLKNRHSCAVIQIVRGQMYVSHEFTSYSNVLRLMQLLLVQVVQSNYATPLPDLEFILTSRDGASNQIPPQLMVFAICAPSGPSRRFLVPDWSYWSYPDHALVFWPLQHQRIVDSAVANPWGKREPKVLYRGGPSAGMRAALIQKGTEFPQYIDARELSGADRNSPLYVSPEGHCRYPVYFYYGISD